MGFVRFVLAAGAAAALAACGTTNVSTAPNAAGEQLYESLYPYYAELCALSQFKKKPGFGAPVSSGFGDGIGGHAVLYLNGACRVADAHYPTIKLCDASPADGEHGVGISVNAHFKNANWIATPGRDFFFHGGLAPHEPLTRAGYQRTQAKAQALGILDGVEFHREALDDMPDGMSQRDYMYEVSVATDYAIGFGRDRYCARVPLDREKMGRIVRFLDDLNAPYRRADKEFDWSVVRNNCSHALHNALAAAGVWDNWDVDRFVLLAAFDFPVPKNEFVNLMQRTNDLPLEDPPALYRDEISRRALLSDRWLPTEPGALAEAEPAVQDNEVYETNLKLIFYDEAITGRYRKRFARIFSEPRYTEIRANLDYFAARYRKINQQRQSLRREAGDAASGAADSLATAFYARFFAYVDGETARVDAAIKSLDQARPSLAKASER
jgi:hypothetical protein